MLWWVLLWVGLVLAGAVVLALLAWGVVRRGLAVGRELARAGERVGELTATTGPGVGGPAPARPRHTVLDDPARLLRELRSTCARPLERG